MNFFAPKKCARVFLFLTFLTPSLFSQSRTLLVYDLKTGVIDSIVDVEYDASLLFDKTEHNYGSFDSNIETLEQEAPTENIYEDSQFTLKEKISASYDLNSFPIRTSVKLFYENQGGLVDRCSGSMISRRHVLSAAHCISEEGLTTLFYDSLYICPAYNEGAMNPNFGCSYVEKVYLFKDWDTYGEDLAIFELKEALGEKTGWIGIGYDETTDQYKDDILYKFSYPNKTISFIDTTEYNGDILYYNYGKVDDISEEILGIMNTRAIPGESGSSIIHTINEETYTSYGVLNYSLDMRHCKINDYLFYPILEVIMDDQTTSVEPKFNDYELSIYPNPSTGIYEIGNELREEIVAYKIFNNLGVVILSGKTMTENFFDLTELPEGIYYLNIETAAFSHSIKLFKS